ncbi:zinc ribbon domain-containing protein [Paludisphaera borealis]|uniref:Uncharacterized protein n=1 Tax=Paludisphaera borealis TaxID=1387353 RepID=A0A1U7CZA4_9BACT|nr:zinc ribbon domain-containing protein [Paludisphaera borealis]APW64292.1 hypothetical protein BSF38_10085 [Paludisphaera borealis]
MKPDTAKILEGIVTACFFGTWVVLGIGGFLVFYLGRDVAFKRKWFPRYILLVGVLFVLFSTTLMVLSSRSLGALGMLVFVIPATALISYLNIKFTYFCNQCGATLHNQNWLNPMRFCSKCGAELDAKPKLRDDLLE